ncbi:MAG: tetratricopeptide repeat protein [Steroidobacteraceae bacterium]
MNRIPSMAVPLAALVMAWLPELASAQLADYDPGRAAALRRCDDALLHGRQEEANRCYRALTGAPAGADPLLRAEALWGLGDIQGANQAFREAVAAAANDPRPRVRWGRLFLSTGQYQDAMRLFQEALEIAPRDYEAGVARARLTADRFSGDVDDALRELIEGNPEGIEAQLVAAHVAIENGRLDEAGGAAQRALALAEAQRRAPLEAYTLLAAVEVTGQRDPARWIRAALAYNPRYGTLFEQLGYFEVIRRRYDEAEKWFARAVEVQPDLWPAHRERGLNLLRLGDVAGARAALERAYSGDRFSTATVNTLRLLDSFGQYEIIQSSDPALRLQLHRKEAAALAPYVGQLARQSIATFAQRYGYTPSEPVTIELYPDHDDFGVRTAGLPGIGLLGVTFGHVVAMDSPSGRQSGDFHWGSTLWHEMAHVFTLSATQHRVPRWLSEGLSMFEEWRTGPTPGVAVGPDLVEAFIGGKFLPVAQLDEGFLRPAYPNQVQISYMQAGLVCLFAEQRWGLPRLVEFLRAFNEDISTAEAVRRVFGVEPEAFDSEFQAFMKQRFAPYIAQPARWKEQMAAARAALEGKRWAAARTAAQAAIELLPEFTAGGNAYQMLAAAEEGAGDKAAAMRALLAWRAAGGWDPEGLRTLAQQLLDAGRGTEALEVLEAVNYVDPLAPGGHAQLGELLLAANRPADALREYQVLLALAPLDTAAANYGLARAWRASGDAARARRHLLQALETAPRFRPAQKLLLEMTGEGSP